MAIKGDRQINAVELRYFMNETASPGVAVSQSTMGSGIALDSASNVATVSASSSGAKPLGLLLTEVVNVDLTKYSVNCHKDQVNIGSKVTVVLDGVVTTDKVISATAGTDAVLTSSGYLMNKPAVGTWNQAANPGVGRWITGTDENGFATLRVNL